MVALLTVAGALLAVSCADPEGELQAFAERCTDQINKGDFAGGTTCDPVKGACDFTCDNPMSGVVDGTYFFTLSASIADDIPLVFLTTVTTEDSGGGALSMTWEMQPLNKDDRKTPVGSPLTVGPFPISGGSMSYIASILAVDGAANPISGSPIEANDLTILSCPAETRAEPGGFCEMADFYCGTIPVGAVSKPAALDIGGSTWTMVRVSGTGTDDYPEPPPINCAKDPAKSVNDL